MSKRTVTITEEDVARMRQAEANEVPGLQIPRAFMDEARATLNRMGIEGFPTAVTVAEGWPDPVYQLIYDDGAQ